MNFVESDISCKKYFCLTAKFAGDISNHSQSITVGDLQ